MLNVKKTLTKILDALKADYIVEQGTSGIWTYRKWNSGISECWGAKAITWASWSTWGTLYYVTSSEENYPTGMFTSVYSVNGQITTNGGDTISSITSRPENLALAAPKITAIRPNAGASPTSGYAFWHTIGRWK